LAEADRLRNLVGLGREDRYLEFKESRPWNDLKPKLCRTTMAMANIRDGGTIVVGVGQRSGSLVAQGVTPADLATYDEDDVLAFVNRYAEPYVRLEVHKFGYEKATLVGIVVREFDEVPVVCRRSYENVLRQGAIYTRSYRIAETCEVQTQTEMREIIEMATDKGIRNFLARSRGAGLRLDEVAARTDAERFREQLGGL
jgi:predicted HTH transcriptional regulator